MRYPRNIDKAYCNSKDCYLEIMNLSLIGPVVFHIVIRYIRKYVILFKLMSRDRSSSM